jgi:hypothetical protein
MAEGLHLMFLVVRYFEQGQAIRGGSLVTDEKTRPVEFRCTSPIRPNDYQRVLYGDTLDGYLFVDLIGTPLVTATKESIDLALVEDKRFLEIRPNVNLPVILLDRSSQDGNTSSITLRAHPKFEAEQAAARSQLVPLFNAGRNLLEPFERVRLALEQAHAQRIGDKNQ